VHVPINLCGNTVNVVGLLNPAIGNTCVNASDNDRGPGRHRGGPERSHHGDMDDSYGGSDGRGPNGPSRGGSHSGHWNGGGDHHGGGSYAGGGTSNSPGVGSGNGFETPIDLPVNACGLGVDIVGIANPTAGNDCENVPATPVAPPVWPDVPGRPGTPVGRNIPPTPVTPETPETQTVTPPTGGPQLAQTGGGASLGIAGAGSAGLLLAGSILYRRARSAA
jgi:hypothetical protein